MTNDIHFFSDKAAALGFARRLNRGGKRTPNFNPWVVVAGPANNWAAMPMADAQKNGFSYIREFGMKTLYLIRGVPGSGKTTLAKQLLSAGIVQAIYAADDWMVDEAGAYKFDRNRLPECHERCKLAVVEALKNNLSVAVHNTFVQIWELGSYYDMAAQLSVQPVEIICNSNFSNTHGVGRETVELMRRKFEI